MKRTAFDERRDQAIADEYQSNHMACSKCGAITPREDLADLGAQCRKCYTAYLAEANPAWMPKRHLTADERKRLIAKAKGAMQSIGKSKADPKQWALNLMNRELDGEKLTQFQSDSWRSVFPSEYLKNQRGVK